VNIFFSIIIPTYNRKSFLSNAIQSVLAQKFRGFELIIVDDGSSDNTKELVFSFNDDRIRYIYQLNRGVCVARNTGIFAAKGKYITFLDSDDWAESNWLDDFYSQIQKRETDLVFCDMSLKYSDGRSVIRQALYRYDNSNPNENGMYMPGAFCIKSELIKRIGGFDPNIKFGEFFVLNLN
jgi:glycosyltransferase involved in cell wall biosynthesis